MGRFGLQAQENKRLFNTVTMLEAESQNQKKALKKAMSDIKALKAEFGDEFADAADDMTLGTFNMTVGTRPSTGGI